MWNVQSEMQAPEMRHIIIHINIIDKMSLL